MNKYGIDNFVFEILEQVDVCTVNEKEKEYIKQFNSYGSTGYNATLGGDGASYLNYDFIVSTYLSGSNVKETAIICGCDPGSVSNILKNHNIEIRSSMSKNRKPVNQFSINGNFLQSFESLGAAAQYMIDKNLTNCKFTTIRTHIGETCKKRRQTCGGFRWEFLEI